jgi:hypothetical protein
MFLRYACWSLCGHADIGSGTPKRIGNGNVFIRTAERREGRDSAKEILRRLVKVIAKNGRGNAQEIPRSIERPKDGTTYEIVSGSLPTIKLRRCGRDSASPAKLSKRKF